MPPPSAPPPSHVFPTPSPGPGAMLGSIPSPTPSPSSSPSSATPYANSVSSPRTPMSATAESLGIIPQLQYVQYFFMFGCVSFNLFRHCIML